MCTERQLLRKKYISVLQLNIHTVSPTSLNCGRGSLACMHFRLCISGQPVYEAGAVLEVINKAFFENKIDIRYRNY